MAERARLDFEPGESHWTYERLRQSLIDACGHERFRRGVVSFDRLPESIDIGKIGEKALECARGTSVDRKERGLSLEYAPTDRKLVMDKQLVTGIESTVSVGPSRKAKELCLDQLAKLPPAKRAIVQMVTSRLFLAGVEEDPMEKINAVYQSDTVDGRALRDVYLARAGNIHSHTRPVPISGNDVAVFLRAPDMRIMVVARPDGLLETVIKSDESGSVSHEEFGQKIEHWNQLLHDRVQAGGRRGFGEIEANQRAQRALIRSIAEKYKFGYYAGNGVGLLERVK